ncbi:Protein polybromo-1 [Trichoplax sp. H2]|nr:Protein polybromo-1 [Trichoplax sp. H2]|eukprot:RDD39168.1 Protein polybromo-1 [Trichoplax sp. H2]
MDIQETSSSKRKQTNSTQEVDAKQKRRKLTHTETNSNYIEEFNNKGNATVSGNSKSTMRKLINDVRQLKDDTGRLICEMFIELPSQEEYPDYYVIIKEPIDLTIIDRRLKGGHYRDLLGLRDDLLLMIKNAHKFNQPGSSIYQDATIIKKSVNVFCNKLQSASGEQSISSRASTTVSEEASSVANASEDEKKEEVNIYFTLYDTVTEFINSNDQSLSDELTKLPSKKANRAYYEVVKNPLSLFKIQSRLRANYYDKLEKLYDDLDLTLQNTQLVNESSSKVYKDATKLRSILKGKYRTLSKLGEMHQSPKKDNNSTSSITDPGESIAESDTNDSTKKMALKKLLKQLFKVIVTKKDKSGRLLCDIFWKLPSKKTYPSYYSVIKKPIDLTQIERRIKLCKYDSEEGLLDDFKLMFDNAKTFNEEGSQIYEDALDLERLLLSKHNNLKLIESSGSNTPIKSARHGKINSRILPNDTSTNGRINVILDAIDDYTDESGANISEPFLELPSRSEYPDYYDVVTKPIDIAMVKAKNDADEYGSIEDAVSDLLLVFENSCKYNDPESQIYKDALKLHDFVVAKQIELEGRGNCTIPNVSIAMQDLLQMIFGSLVTTKIGSHSPYRSIVEFSRRRKSKDQKNAPKLDLSEIWEMLRKKEYRSLNKLQNDLFSIIVDVRKNVGLDSQHFADAVHLQKLFIQERDRLSDERLQSVALNYTLMKLETELNEEKAANKEANNHANELEDKSEESKRQYLDKIVKGGITFRKGEYAYIIPREKNLKPHIMCIEDLWKSPSNSQWISGTWYYRPAETFHSISTKFYKNEVFRSDINHSVKASSIMGKCHVMYVKDFIRSRAKNFPEDDIYVCESRYYVRSKSFKKMKVWDSSQFEAEYELRDEILQLDRFSSVFANVNQSNSDTTTGSSDATENVLLPSIKEEGKTFYEQHKSETGTFKLGDYVYVRSEESWPYIARIDKIWNDSKTDLTYFHGPWFVRPLEIKQSSNQEFYLKEVFLSNIEDTNPILSIIGRCSVFSVKDYCSCRIVDIPEVDVYICESKYNERDHQIRKLRALKKHTLSSECNADEIYYFPSEIEPSKAPLKKLHRSDIQQSEETNADSEPSDDDAQERSSLEDGPHTQTPSRNSTAVNSTQSEQINGDTPIHPSNSPYVHTIVPPSAPVYSNTPQANPMPVDVMPKAFHPPRNIFANAVPNPVSNSWIPPTSTVVPNNPRGTYVVPHAVPSLTPNIPPNPPQMVPVQPPQNYVPAPPPTSEQQNNQPKSQQLAIQDVFVSPPKSARKLLHSNAYNRYLDALEKEQNFPPSQPRNSSLRLKPEEWLASSALINNGNYIEILRSLKENLLRDAVRLSSLYK